MIKTLIVIILSLLPMSLLACPACASGDVGSGASKVPYTLIILSCFILLTYIPFYLLFRAAKKYEPNNNNENL